MPKNEQKAITERVLNRRRAARRRQALRKWSQEWNRTNIDLFRISCVILAIGLGAIYLSTALSVMLYVAKAIPFITTLPELAGVLLEFIVALAFFFTVLPLVVWLACSLIADIIKNKKRYVAFLKPPQPPRWLMKG